ncbi:MAG: alpha/beta fold hydrolase [Nocardioides sp.]
MTGKIAGGAAGVAGIAAAGAAVGVARQRSRIGRRGGVSPAFGSLRAPELTVVADDGVPLHVEIDERAPGADGATVIFIHGYALNLDCWHFQRQHMREHTPGPVRSVFYDQRSHGRSARAHLTNTTIEQLGEDLATVIEQTAGDDPIVLVGHSMGGMTIFALAETHPELFEADGPVAGVVLISTTAGGLDPARLMMPLVPKRVGTGLTNSSLRVLTRGHRAVDGARRIGRGLATVMTDRFAFGAPVPAGYVEFVNDMLSATPFEVVAGFFPSFGALDKFEVVKVLSKVPTTIVCGTSDKLTSIGHSRKLNARIEGSSLVECLHAGHMVILEQADAVNHAIDQVLVAAGGVDQ